MLPPIAETCNKGSEDARRSEKSKKPGSDFNMIDRLNLETVEGGG